jgi:hypothetical protein
MTVAMLLRNTLKAAATAVEHASAGARGVQSG